MHRLYKEEKRGCRQCPRWGRCWPCVPSLRVFLPEERGSPGGSHFPCCLSFLLHVPIKGGVRVRYPSANQALWNSDIPWVFSNSALAHWYQHPSITTSSWTPVSGILEDPTLNRSFSQLRGQEAHGVRSSGPTATSDIANRSHHSALSTSESLRTYTCSG